jgi:hypothetical protein
MFAMIAASWINGPRQTSSIGQERLTSEMRLVLRDAEQSLSGTIHGSVLDQTVAALLAEPEPSPS